MNKNEFFNVLMDNLKDIPEKKLQDIIWNYENLFDLEIQKGKSEEEIVKNFGNIDIMTNRLKDEILSSNYTKNSLENDSIINIYKDNDLNLNTNYIASAENYSSSSNKDKNTYPYKKEKRKHSYLNNPIKKGFNINSILKIGIFILSIIIFVPILATILGIIVGILGTTIGLFAGSIGLLIGGTFNSFIGISNVPNFISNFPYPALLLFCLGTITLSIILFLLFYYFIKAIIIGSKKLYSILFL